MLGAHLRKRVVVRVHREVPVREVRLDVVPGGQPAKRLQSASAANKRFGVPWKLQSVT